MTIVPSQVVFESRDLFVRWRSQYPKFAALIDSGAGTSAALRYLGIALWQDQNLDEAASVMVANASLCPNDPQILGELGSLLSMTDQKDDALHYLTASLSLDAGQPLVWLNLAGLCNEIGNKEMAEHAFRAVLDINPMSVDATTGLGLLYLESRRFADAIAFLQSAIAQGANGMAIYACLGQAHYLLGEFTAAKYSFEAALNLEPNQTAIIKKLSYARLLEALVATSVSDATKIYFSSAGALAEPINDVLRTAFQILSGYQHTDAAVRVGETLLAMSPGDPIVTYHLDALLGRAHTRAPDAYVAACFDKYAATFNKHLVKVLDYNIPEKASSMLATADRRFERTLDLGCGTGLAAPQLLAVSDTLIGVDLSPRMLDEARKLNVYAELIEAEAVAYLKCETAPFDLIAALDVLVYFGDLAPLFHSVAARIERGGMFLFCYELGTGEGFSFLATGRYAHAPNYIASLIESRFEVVSDVETILRLEVNSPIASRLVLLRRS